MTLRQDLEGVYAPEVGRKLLSLLTPEELKFVQAEISSNFERTDYDKRWSELFGARVRTYLASKVNSSSVPLLSFSLFPELPIELILGWESLVKTIDRHPERSMEIFQLNNLIDSEFIVYFWDNYADSLDWTIRTTGTRSLTLSLKAYANNEKIPLVERLATCGRLQVMPHIEGWRTLPPFLEGVQKHLSKRVKKQLNLGDNIPDSWVLELIK